MLYFENKPKAQKNRVKTFYQKIGMYNDECLGNDGYCRFDKIIPLYVRGLAEKYYLARNRYENRVQAILTDDGLIIAEFVNKQDFDVFNQRDLKTEISRDYFLKLVAKHISQQPMLIGELHHEIFKGGEFKKAFKSEHIALLIKKSEEIKDDSQRKDFDKEAENALLYLDGILQNKMRICEVLAIENKLLTINNHEKPLKKNNEKSKLKIMDFFD